MLVDYYEYVTLTVFYYLLGFADKTSFLDVEGFVFLLLLFGDRFVHGKRVLSDQNYECDFYLLANN